VKEDIGLNLLEEEMSIIKHINNIAQLVGCSKLFLTYLSTIFLHNSRGGGPEQDRATFQLLRTQADQELRYWMQTNRMSQFLDRLAQAET
jgi:hypothetical protein